MWRQVAVLSSVCVLSAVLTAWVTTLAIGAEGTLPPPLYGLVPVQELPTKACLATYEDSNLGTPSRTQTWVISNPPYQGYTGWWKYTWKNWTYDFSCGNATTPMCAICYYVEVEYYSTANNQWVVAGLGISQKTYQSGSCNNSYHVTCTNNYDYPYKAGTMLRQSWYIADYDPSLPDCNGQTYYDRPQDNWSVDPDGP